MHELSGFFMLSDYFPDVRIIMLYKPVIPDPQFLADHLFSELTVVDLAPNRQDNKHHNT